jgi:hypothetical protein
MGAQIASNTSVRLRGSAEPILQSNTIGHTPFFWIGQFKRYPYM